MPTYTVISNEKSNVEAVIIAPNRAAARAAALASVFTIREATTEDIVDFTRSGKEIKRYAPKEAKPAFVDPN
ncbi:MAG: hypothetical protein IPM06_18570 [Rhizobiales bacterium]|nr:hypothetical protein [Hyphomicrobiales bacterium]